MADDDPTQKARHRAEVAPAPPQVELVGRQFVFVVGDRLGEGGMAEVFRAKSKDGALEVAIKKPRASLRSEDKVPFLREAEAAAKAAGPGVVRVIDWGEDPPFIAYELVSDPTLAAEIDRRQKAAAKWNVAEQATLFFQLVAAMKTVNQYVLHRDLKPSNIFRGAAGVRIADFGLAKFVDEATRTRTFKNWGTPLYMPPEAWRGLSLDWRADQYSLGVVFYEIATLQLPFRGSDEELERKHLYEQAPRADAVTPELPPRLASLIARMLEKRTADRFGSWDEVSKELTATAQSLASPIKAANEPIAQVLIQKLDAHQRQELERQRLLDEAHRAKQEREGLSDYWWRQFADKARARFDTLNQAAGKPAINYTSSHRHLAAHLLNANFDLFCYAAPSYISEDVAAWGLIKTRTAKSICVANLLLLKEPQPYGQWLEVSMEVSPIATGRIDSSLLASEAGGEPRNYEIIGNNRIVVAQGVSELLAQRKLKNVMSLVQYREEPLDFDRTLGQCLEVFVRDATATPS